MNKFPTFSMKHKRRQPSCGNEIEGESELKAEERKVSFYFDIYSRKPFFQAHLRRKK